MKKTINKLIILLLVFLLVIGGYFILNYEPKEDTTATMGEATLPILYMCRGSERINRLYGYSIEMNAALMKDSLTPIPDDRALKVQIENGSSKIISVEYELRSLDTTRLIEKSSAAEFKSGKDFTEATLAITNMIETNTEYLLIIEVTTAEQGKVYYYTHINQIKDGHYDAQVSYVYDFSKKTLDKIEAEALISYLEPDSSEDNTNLGKVNIHSNFNQVTWGNLIPERVTNPVITIKEIFGDIGCYELKYIIKAKNDYDTYQYYNISEFYRVRSEKDTFYLLSYDRTMNQIFSASTQNISVNRINLGIREDLSAKVITNENNTLINFVQERNLWCMDTKTNRITTLFSFAGNSDTDKGIDTNIRNINDMHDINVLSADDDGNVNFIVYGYMNRGEHEGKVGITLYKFMKETELVEEVVFIPYTKPYGVLKEMMGKFTYVNDNKILYIMLDNSVYSVDLQGKEYVEIVTGLGDGNYVINKENSIIAWQVGKNLYDVNTIRVLDIETGKDYTLTAEKGEKLRVLGYIEDDLVYGIAKEADIIVDQNGYTTFAMSTLYIINSDKEVVGRYSKEGVYFTEAVINENMVNLKRIKKSEDQTSYVNTSDDQIIKNAEPDESKVMVKTIVTDLKKREIVINFAYQVTTSDKLKILKPKEIIFDQINTINIKNATSDPDRYYVYGKGSIQGIYTNAGLAVKNADDLSGVVVDNKGYYVWAKVGKLSEMEIPGIDYTEKQIAKKKDLDLSGCKLEQILYYISNGIPVAAYQNNNECVVVVGYDFYNVILYSPSTGESNKMGLEEAGEMFEEIGNKFFTLMQ